MPRLLRDIIVGALESQQDMELTADIQDASALRPALAEHQPDILLLGCGESEVRGSLGELLWEFPRLMVFTITGEGRSTFLYELVPTKLALGEVSPATLFETIRESAAVRDWPPAFETKRESRA